MTLTAVMQSPVRKHSGEELFTAFVTQARESCYDLSPEQQAAHTCLRRPGEQILDLDGELHTFVGSFVERSLIERFVMTNHHELYNDFVDWLEFRRGMWQPGDDSFTRSGTVAPTRTIYVESTKRGPEVYVR